VKQQLEETRERPGVALKKRLVTQTIDVAALKKTCIEGRLAMRRKG
jgi:hypothetical protein